MLTIDAGAAEEARPRQEFNQCLGDGDPKSWGQKLAIIYYSSVGQVVLRRLACLLQGIRMLSSGAW